MSLRSVACEPFAQVKATGRFTLRDEGKTIAIGKVLKDSAQAQATVGAVSKKKSFMGKQSSLKGVSKKRSFGASLGVGKRSSFGAKVHVFCGGHGLKGDPRSHNLNAL